MEIAICDDDKVIREQIRGLIKQQRADAAVALYESGEELLACKRQFDLVFLDIQMKGKNGIETARMLQKTGEDTILVFVTECKEYVFDAFDVGAFHYLLKPLSEKKFAEVLEKAVRKTEKRSEEHTSELQSQR